MKIISLNKVDSAIIGRAENLNDYYFKDINIAVGLFQSTKYECMEWYESYKQKPAPAVVVSDEEFDLQKRDFTEIRELEGCFDKNIPVIVWFGKSLSQNKKYRVNHVVGHELQHIKQRETDLTTYYKDRVLSFILDSEKEITKKIPTNPSEIDANNFADMTDYDWVKETQKLFDKNLKKIKIEFDISKLKNKNHLFQYYFNKTKCQN